MATIVLVAGVIALITSLLSFTGGRALERQGAPPQVPMSKASMRLFNLPRSFVPAFFGIISIAFPGALTESTLGLTLCWGMGVFFALQGWAYARSPEIRALGPYIGTYLAFGAGACYLVAALAASVI